MESPENGNILNDSIDQLEAIVDTNQSPYVFYSTSNNNHTKDNLTKLPNYRQPCDTPSQTPRFNKFNSSEIHPSNSYRASLYRLPSNFESIESFCCKDQQKQIMSSQAESGRGSSSRIGGIASSAAGSSPVPVFGVANCYQGSDSNINGGSDSMQGYSLMSQQIGITAGKKDGIFQRFEGEESEITKNHRKQQYNHANTNRNENYHANELFHGDNVLADKNFTFYNGSQKTATKKRMFNKKDKNKGDDNDDEGGLEGGNDGHGNKGNINEGGISSGARITASTADELQAKKQMNYNPKGKGRSISSYYSCHSEKPTGEQQQCMIAQDLLDDSATRKSKGNSNSNNSNKKKSQSFMAKVIVADLNGVSVLALNNNSNLIQERKQLAAQQQQQQQIVDDQQVRRKKKILPHYQGVSQIAKTEPDEGSSSNNSLRNGNNVLGCLSHIPNHSSTTTTTFQNSTYQNYLAQLRQNFASSESQQLSDQPQQQQQQLPKQDQQVKQNNFLSSAKVISYQLNRIRQQVSLQQQVSAAKALREDINNGQTGINIPGGATTTTTPLKDKNTNPEYNNNNNNSGNIKLKSSSNNTSSVNYTQMNPSVKFLRKAFSQQGQAALNHSHNHNQNSFITKITPIKDDLGQIAMKVDSNNSNSIAWRRSRSAERGNSSSKLRSDSEGGDHYYTKRKRIVLGSQNYQMFESRGLMVLPQSTQSEQSWQLFNDRFDNNGEIKQSQQQGNVATGASTGNPSPLVAKKPQSSSYPTRNHKQQGKIFLNCQIDNKMQENHSSNHSDQIDDLFFNHGNTNSSATAAAAVDGAKQQTVLENNINNLRIQSAKLDANNSTADKRNKFDSILLTNSHAAKMQQSQQPQQQQQQPSQNESTSKNPNAVNTQLDYASNYVSQGSSKKQEKKIQISAGWHLRKINKGININNHNSASQHKKQVIGSSISSAQNNQSGIIDEFISEDAENLIISTTQNQDKIMKITKVKASKDTNNSNNQFIRCSSLNQENINSSSTSSSNHNSNNLRASLDVKRNMNGNYLNADAFSLRAHSQIPKGHSINENSQKYPKCMQFDLSPISPLAMTFLQPKGIENSNGKNHIFFPNLPARRADSAGRATKPAFIINNNNNSSNQNSNHIARAFSRQTNSSSNNNNSSNSPTFVSLAQQVIRKI